MPTDTKVSPSNQLTDTIATNSKPTSHYNITAAVYIQAFHRFLVTESKNLLISYTTHSTSPFLSHTCNHNFQKVNLTIFTVNLTVIIYSLCLVTLSTVNKHFNAESFQWRQCGVRWLGIHILSPQPLGFSVPSR